MECDINVNVDIRTTRVFGLQWAEKNWLYYSGVACSSVSKLLSEKKY
jgi:hypothetical protein